MIELRPHHLLCILNYIGKGYSESFTQNYDHITQRINQGEHAIKIVRGPDAICAPLKDDPDNYHCENESVQRRDDTTLQDLTRLLGHSIDYGDSLTLDQNFIENARQAFKNHTIRTACQGCEWFELCESISQDDYKDTKLT